MLCFLVLLATSLSLQVSRRAGVPENSDPADLVLVLTGCWALCPVSDPEGLGWG